jgi:hypothetical protein
MEDEIMMILLFGMIILAGIWTSGDSFRLKIVSE